MRKKQFIICLLFFICAIGAFFVGKNLLIKKSRIEEATTIFNWMKTSVEKSDFNCFHFRWESTYDFNKYGITWEEVGAKTPEEFESVIKKARIGIVRCLLSMQTIAGFRTCDNVYNKFDDVRKICKLLGNNFFGEIGYSLGDLTRLERQAYETVRNLNLRLLESEDESCDFAGLDFLDYYGKQMVCSAMATQCMVWFGEVCSEQMQDKVIAEIREKVRQAKIRLLNRCFILVKEGQVKCFYNMMLKAEVKADELELGSELPRGW